jgi:hypothetical protein
MKLWRDAQKLEFSEREPVCPRFVSLVSIMQQLGALVEVADNVCQQVRNPGPPSKPRHTWGMASGISAFRFVFM